MTEQTFDRRYDQLLTLINIHPYKTELLNIMQQQIEDESVIINTKYQIAR